MARETPVTRAPLVQVRFTRLRREGPGLLFVLPAVLVLALVIAYPVIDTIRLSLSRVVLGQAEAPFAGLENYAAVLGDPAFATALRNTAIWTGLCVAVILLLGLLAALVVHERFVGRSAVRSALLIPWIIPGIVAAVTWKWLYHPNFGFVNHLLIALGLSREYTNWLANPTWALYAVILVNIWKSFPFAMLMLLAGLQGLPGELYEAARVDGASAPQRLRHLTLPLLRPVMLVVALLLTIWNLSTFTYVYVLTGGGPVRLTEVLGIYIYSMAFQSFKFGQAAAAAVILFLISAALSVVYLRVLRATTD
jgi:multiple sugar transport system permease protein